VKPGLLGACAAALFGACGGTRPPARPAPAPGPEPTPVAAVPSGPLHYRIRASLAYEVERYDSLFYASMPGAPQATAKRGVLSVRPVPGRSGEVEVRLDSLAGLEETHLTPAVVDSSIGSRWQLTLGPAGPKGAMLGGRSTILSGQIEVITRLLFPPLPNDGVRLTDVWADSAAYRVRLDAFDAHETASRNSQAVPNSGTAGTGITVDVSERLSRTGSAMQGGQPMTLTGSGSRRLRYEFAPEGWVRSLTARDSLDLVVTVGAAGGEAVRVRWRSTLIGRLRDVPIR
jgi:hypothetical protein